MALRLLALCALAMLAVGCSAAVHPPQVRMNDAVPVYVCDYGVHSAVMLPVSQTRYVEYAFGDWGFCTHLHEGPQDALGALIVSFRSAFGRRFIELKPGQAYPVPCIPPKHVIKIYASRESIEAEVKKLDERWQQGAREKIVHNPENDTDYVHDTHRYSWTNSCNHLTARTLRDLGCRVDGATIFSNFHLSDPLAPEPVETTTPVYATGGNDPPAEPWTHASSRRSGEIADDAQVSAREP